MGLPGQARGQGAGAAVDDQRAGGSAGIGGGGEIAVETPVAHLIHVLHDVHPHCQRLCPFPALGDALATQDEERGDGDEDGGEQAQGQHDLHETEAGAPGGAARAVRHEVTCVYVVVIWPAVEMAMS